MNARFADVRILSFDQLLDIPKGLAAERAERLEAPLVDCSFIIVVKGLPPWRDPAVLPFCAAFGRLDRGVDAEALDIPVMVTKAQMAVALAGVSADCQIGCRVEGPATDEKQIIADAHH
jgi:hypothetical protein